VTPTQLIAASYADPTYRRLKAKARSKTPHAADARARRAYIIAAELAAMKPATRAAFAAEIEALDPDMGLK
jgi:hypothetical protein